METSADHLKATIEKILEDIKLLEEKFADDGQIQRLVQRIKDVIQESDAKDVVILKQHLGIVLTDMENMDTRAFKYTWKTRFLRAMMIGSSSKDRHDDDITEKKKVMEDLGDKAENFWSDIISRSFMKEIFEEFEDKFERDLELVGREKEKEEIIDQLILLCGKVPVIIIAGISGIGKTKLASSVCEDMNVQQQVGMAARVIGVHYNTFDADSIAKQVIRSVVTATIVAPHQHGRMTADNNLNIIVILDDCLDWRVEIEDKDVKALQDKLKEDWRVEIEGIDVKTLQELEDDWEIEGICVEAVDKLKEARPLVTAVMIITTSSCHVAMARNITARPVKSYALPELNENEIVSFLQLLDMDADDDWNLEADYYWTVGKSRGVPRALLTAILTLCYSDSQLTDSGLMEELTYSYYDEGLPHLCFAYCSLFPQDYLFDAERLIHLWMAEGFLTPSTSSSTSEADEYLMPEEIGRKYLMDLVGRSIFQDVKEDELGQVRSFRMHPLMHDIARFLADWKNITVDPKGYKVHQKVLRASFDLRLHFSHGIPSHPLFDKAKQLRSILFFAAKTQSSLLHSQQRQNLKSLLFSAKTPSGLPLQVEMSTPMLENIFKSFEFLGVLDLRGLKITAVPNSIGELKFLEYLDLSQNDMEKLPSSIAKLSNLQTLKLSRCYSLRELPKDFKKLNKLKHLDMEGCMGLTGMPPQMSTLSSLQTLSAFVVSKKEAMGSLEELAKLNKLRGYLEILYLDRVPKLYGETNGKYLKEKLQLQRLKLKWDLGVEQADCSHHMSVLESLEPHSHLKVLFLEGYQGESLSTTWLTSIQLTSLVKLSLHNCPGCEYLSEQDQLPKLKILELVRLENLFSVVKECDKDADFYKTLQELTIIDCPTLKEWYRNWNVEIFFARISKLHVHNCPKLEKMPLLDMVLEGSTSTSFSKELVLEGSSLNLLLQIVKDSIPFENLHIQNCKDLKKLSDVFKRLGSLQRLTIENCADIYLERPFEKMKKCAETNPDDGKSNQYWEGLKSLRFLTLREIPNLRSLPFSDSVTTLCELTLQSCHGLTSISESIGKLTSLRRLEISKCNKLKSLPKTMTNLKSLKILIILDCTLLLPRCQEETGDDWPQIRHIKHREVK